MLESRGAFFPSFSLSLLSCSHHISYIFLWMLLFTLDKVFWRVFFLLRNIKIYSVKGFLWMKAKTKRPSNIIKRKKEAIYKFFSLVCMHKGFRLKCKNIILIKIFGINFPSFRLPIE